jgi:hypothetical protein
MGICRTEVLCAIRFIPLWTLILILILLKFLRRAIMASGAGLPIRSAVRLFGALAAVSIGYGMTKVDFKRIVLKTVTGPGSTSRIIAILLVLANLKNVPLAWHVRILQSQLRKSSLLMTRAVAPSSRVSPFKT